MKYSQSSVLFASLVLSIPAACASRASGEQGKNADTLSSSFWNYFGFRSKAPVAPASVVSIEKSVKGPDDSWTLVDIKVDEDDDEHLALTEERVTKDEIKIHNQEMEKRALERYEKNRLARARKAEETEALLGALMPNEPKMSAKWYQDVAPLVLQEANAVMMTESEDEQPVQGLEMFESGEAVLLEDEVEAEDQQPPLIDDQIPDAPPMIDVLVPRNDAPVQAVAEDTEKPKGPNVFRGKLVQQMGFAKSGEFAVSASEVSLIQQFKTAFQGAKTRSERQEIVSNMEQALKENPGFMELLKLKVQLRLQVNREVIDSDNEESEEDQEFD